MQKSYQANAPQHDRQTKPKEGQQITAVWRNGGRRGKLNICTSNKHLYLVDSFVLRKPPLRQAAKRQAVKKLTSSLFKPYFYNAAR